MKEFLDKYVVGQDLAKIILSSAVYYHYKRVKHNIPFKKPSEPLPQETNIPKTLYFPKGNQAFCTGYMFAFI